MLDIWDCSSPLRPSVKTNAHQAEALSCSWNQFHPYVLATGGSEGLIRIWDMRKLLTPIFQLEVCDNYYYPTMVNFVIFNNPFCQLIITGMPGRCETRAVFATPLVYVGISIIRFHD